MNDFGSRISDLATEQRVERLEMDEVSVFIISEVLAQSESADFPTVRPVELSVVEHVLVLISRSFPEV